LLILYFFSLLLSILLISISSFFSGIKKLNSKGIYQENRGIGFLIGIISFISLYLQYEVKVIKYEDHDVDNSWVILLIIIFVTLIVYRYWIITRDFLIQSSKEKISDLVNELLLKYSISYKVLQKNSNIILILDNDKSKIKIVDGYEEAVFLKFINYRQIPHFYSIIEDITDSVHKSINEKKSYNGIGDILLGVVSLFFLIFMTIKLNNYTF